MLLWAFSTNVLYRSIIFPPLNLWKCECPSVRRLKKTAAPRLDSAQNPVSPHPLPPALPTPSFMFYDTFYPLLSFSVSLVLIIGRWAFGFMIILEAPGIALVAIAKMLNGKSNSPGSPQGHRSWEYICLRSIQICLSLTSISWARRHHSHWGIRVHYFDFDNLDYMGSHSKCPNRIIQKHLFHITFFSTD